MFGRNNILDETARIGDYGVVGDCQSMGLVSRHGSIDWLCLPRFDSGACFAKLLGDENNGFWSIRPTKWVAISRRYLDGTLILETNYQTEHGEATVTDFMPPRNEAPDLIRIVKGVRGEVEMECAISLRFDYGEFVPWVKEQKEGAVAVAGPDKIHFYSPIKMKWEKGTSRVRFSVKEGESVAFTLTWYPSYQLPPRHYDPDHELAQTRRWWEQWSSRSTYQGEWKSAVDRSLITLKALTYEPSGGIVAAGTTSLPEQIRGSRNWDYRYCWLRDATFTLYALMCAGYVEEARAWRDWLLRATAGAPSQMQVIYGVAGERRLTEARLAWLPGYENSSPVRIGNAAHTQFQLDVFGELMDVFHVARRSGLDPEHDDWKFQRELVEYLEGIWREPDAGIWEIRGEPQHFTHSKVMTWVALDRAIRATEMMGLDGPTDRWKALRSEIHKEVCEKGFDVDENTFVQHYGGKDLDAACLMIPLVGFLPASDPRVRGTVSAIEKGLMQDGFVKRYRSASGVDGIRNPEGAFLACSFWFVDNLCLQGRREDATLMFKRLLAVRNDLGLLSEEYDFRGQGLVGNFPQAFSHVALINSAYNLSNKSSPALHRSTAESEVA